MIACEEQQTAELVNIIDNKRKSSKDDSFKRTPSKRFSDEQLAHYASDVEDSP